jgi:hypothetical protein
VYAGQERKMYAGYLVLQKNNQIIDSTNILPEIFLPIPLPIPLYLL